MNRHNSEHLEGVLLCLNILRHVLQSVFLYLEPPGLHIRPGADPGIQFGVPCVSFSILPCLTQPLHID